MDFSKIKEIMIPEGKVIKIVRNLDGALIWKAVTSRIPSEYQEVEWIQAGANVGAYIDLGFSYDTGATVCLGQWVMNDNTAYPFGAAENSGALRCMISCPYNGGPVAYCSKDSTYQAVGISGGYTLNTLNEYVATYKRKSLVLQNVIDGTSNRFDEMISYSMSNNLYLFAQNYNGSPRFGDIRRISYFKYYDKNDTLICDLIPCYRKSDWTLGMYDVVRDIFLTNKGTGKFEANVPVAYTNLVPIARNLDGTILDGIGYRRGAYAANGKFIADDACTAVGFISFDGTIVHDIYVYGLDFTGNSHHQLCLLDSSFTYLDGGVAIKDGFTSSVVPSVTKLGEHYYKITTKAYSTKVVKFNLGGATVNNLTPIVTLDEPIFEEKPPVSYTNLAEPLPDNTTDTSKWVNGYRFNSSSQPVEEYSSSPSTLSNMIPCKFGDIIRVKGAVLRENSDRTVVYMNHSSTGAEMAVCGYFQTNLLNGIVDYIEYLGFENGVYTFKCHDGSVNGAHIIKGFRFAMTTPTNPEDVIITVNEEIL